MKERPILFSGPMVRAILEGRKTQTRRVVKPQPAATMTDAVSLGNTTWCFTGPQRDGNGNPKPLDQWVGGWPECGPNISCPYGIPGDRLVVREQYWAWGKWVPNGISATGRKKWKFVPVGTSLRFQENPPKATAKRDGECGWVYRHARYMPKKHSRITLEIADVRVQRVQEISEEDAEAEGVWSNSGNPVRWKFQCLWDSINAKRGFGWDSNPWVWPLTFRRLEAN